MRQSRQVIQINVTEEKVAENPSEELIQPLKEKASNKGSSSKKSTTSKNKTSSTSKSDIKSTLEGSITLREPNPKIKAKSGVKLQGLGSQLSGLYFVEQVKHSFTSSGYKQTLDLSRKWKGESMKNGGSKTPSKTSTKKPTTNKSTVKPAVKSKSYTVKKGDCLWNIAKKYYGDGNKYTKIYNANKDKIKNPNLIYPGQSLKIP